MAQETNIETSTWTSNEQTIAGYWQHREGTPSLVCIHGAGCQHHIWSPLLSHFPNETILAPSLPGRSGTTGPARQHVADLAEWLLECCREKDIHRPVLVGHSLGGAIAMEAALMAEHTVQPRGLVLITTGAKLRVHENIFRMLREAAEAADTHSIFDTAWQPSTPQTTKDLVNQHTPPLGTLFYDWKSVNKFNRMNELPQIKQQTLVLAGEQDPFTPVKYAQYLANHIPNSKLEIVPDAGHMMPMEQPAQIATAMQSWMRTSCFPDHDRKE
jgi:pimeloyl-ACP methyl ester carboxylesterase